MKNLAQFQTTSDFDREYLRDEWKIRNIQNLKTNRPTAVLPGSVEKKSGLG